jgi:hypothetical protein
MTETIPCPWCRHDPFQVDCQMCNGKRVIFDHGTRREPPVMTAFELLALVAIAAALIGYVAWRMWP